jgi:hypothetical protein
MSRSRRSRRKWNDPSWRTAKKAAPDDGKAQSQRFIEAAREFGADGDAGKFRRAVRTVAKATPKPSKPAAKRKR